MKPEWERAVDTVCSGLVAAVGVFASYAGIVGFMGMIGPDWFSGKDLVLRVIAIPIYLVGTAIATYLFHNLRLPDA